MFQTFYHFWSPQSEKLWGGGGGDYIEMSKLLNIACKFYTFSNYYTKFSLLVTPYSIGVRDDQ